MSNGAAQKKAAASLEAARTAAKIAADTPSATASDVRVTMADDLPRGALLWP